MSKRMRIVHTTEYRYRVPVTFGVHRVLMRPREGHDIRITEASVEVVPRASVDWLRDIHGNSIAMITFLEPSALLRIHSDLIVDLNEARLMDCGIAGLAREYPFQYAADEQIDILPFRIPSYPHDGERLLEWLRAVYQPGTVVNTLELLQRLNTAVFDTIRYAWREEYGVQLPCETLKMGTGSCRDYAVFMMEAARHLGFAARFVTGYIQMGEGQHGATHAWTEIYLPGAGWRGFDPTNNKMAGAEHVAVAVTREQEKASPISGSWDGPPDAFRNMHVVVRVEAA
ncbi:MAG: transglutaminase family protein [Akkermansiaceae bacterium]|jgi:transglutaminase-like putative cysteine protease|nr:transglutaminase family protein [Akkermansiaceae bacterium]MCU0778525.1 transglutaminase family protein [Akkermansiaceae bacterium]